VLLQHKCTVIVAMCSLYRPVGTRRACWRCVILPLVRRLRAATAVTFLVTATATVNVKHANGSLHSLLFHAEGWVMELCVCACVCVCVHLSVCLCVCVSVCLSECETCKWSVFCNTFCSFNFYLFFGDGSLENLVILGNCNLVMD